jgi:hypothetical protein
MLGHLKSLLVKLWWKTLKSTEEFSGRNSQSIRSFPKENYKIGDFVSMSKLQAAQVVPKRRINWFKRDELENLKIPLINTK